MSRVVMSDALSIQQLVWARSIPEPNTGCWLWLGRFSGRPLLKGKKAHRLSLAAFKGPIPAGLNALHTCHNIFCVNPDHLYAGTKKQNTDDMMRAGRCGAHSALHREGFSKRLRALNAKRRTQTHCKRGHPLSGENLYVRDSKYKSRVCRTCEQARKRHSYELRKGKRNDI